MKKTLLIIVSLLMVFLLVACGSKKEKTQTLIVGMEASYAPFNWTVTEEGETTHPLFGQGGSYVDGYDVVISKALSDKLDVNLVIKAIEWDGLLPALASGEIDMIIAGMSPTDERKLEINFSDVYYRSKIVMVVNKNGSYTDATTLKEFKSSRVVAQRGTLYDDLIPQIDSVIHQTPLDTYAALATSVSSNTSDAFVAELPVAKSIVAANSNLRIVEFLPDAGFSLDETDISVAIGLRKNDLELLNNINLALKEIDDETRNLWMDEAVIRSEGEITKGIWNILIKYLNLFLKGIFITILLAVLGTIGGFFVSLLLLYLSNTKIDKKRDSKIQVFLKKFKKGIVTIYITLFRGTPMIVQAMIFYYGIKSLGDISFWTPLVASIFIVILNTAAYIAEIIRGSINALDKGQNEAAVALGLTRFETLKTIIYPQAIKNSLPAIGNEFIVNLKDTAVLSIIGVLDLFNATRQVVGATYNTISPFVITAIIYLILTSISSLLIKKLEKKGVNTNV